MINSNWETLLKKSELYAQKSKPEVLAILEILSEENPLSFSDICDSFKEYFPNSDINQRRLRYTLTLMMENKIIYQDEDKLYNMVDINEKKKLQLQKSHAFLLITGVVMVFIFFNKDFYMNIAIGFLSGIALFIVVIQIEYYFFIENKEKDLINFF